MQFIYNLNQKYQQNPCRFKEPDIIPKSIYNALDFKTSIIGGSYALKRFTGALWDPHDIDIFITGTDAEFKEAKDKFITLTNAILLSDNHTKHTKHTKNNEDFHALISGTYTFNIPGFSLPIQLIHFKQIDHKPTVFEFLKEDSCYSIHAKTTDIPSVSYTIENGQKIFHIPERSLEAIFTRRINGNNICSNRRKLYASRGYTIFDE